MKKLIILIMLCPILFIQCSAPKPVVKTVPVTLPAKPIIKEPIAEKQEVVLDNVITSSEKAEGWKLLFDGTSTDGWHAYGSRSIGTAWKIGNGVMALDASQKNGWQSDTGGDIVTDEEFDNFELQLDWRIDRNGNSGICFYIKEDKDKYPYMWNTGPEMQILDNDGHEDGKIYKHKAGDLYDLIASKTNAVLPPLQWNHVLIKCVNGKLDCFLNSIIVVSTILWNENWNNLIASSKFKNMPDFGTFHRGKIGLQDHGNNVWFRNIKIKRL
jgi:hypothetical protein